MPAAEQVTGPVAEHGEGPVWSESWGGLRFVDMLAGDVLDLDAATGTVGRTHVGTVAAVVRPRAGGGAIVALERGFAVTDGPLDALRPLVDVPLPAGVRLNEGGADPAGRFYCGSMAYAETPGAGTFYRLEVDGTLAVQFDGVTVSNGFGFSPDGARAYYVDTPTHRVDVLDYDADTGLGERRPWIEIPAEAGSPDGLTVDSAGNVWVALWGGGVARRYTPEGRLDEVVEVPATNVTACAVGGERLYLTTSRHGVDPAREPAAGALFGWDSGVAGLPILPYAG